jgi:predicted  nucleic acid-binding Zn-ribbon protein
MPDQPATLRDQVLQVHHRANELADLRAQLPSRPPSHSNHAATEQKVRELAYQVMREAQDLRTAGTEYDEQIQHLIFALDETRIDPYCRLVHRFNLSLLE